MNSPMFSSRTNMVLFFILRYPVHLEFVLMNYVDVILPFHKWLSYWPNTIHGNVHLRASNFR